MIDHILGRPSTRFRKWQVFTVVLFWSFYLSKFSRHGPPGVQRLSRWLSSRFTMHQALVASGVALYVSRNFARVVGLESPEPLANLYDRSFFRATWITTALDAGWWTAMHLRPKWLRHSCEIIFTVYYLVCAEQADELVKRVRGDLNVQHLRVSWNKPNSPVLRWVTGLMRPKFMKYPPRPITIPRPKNSDYKEPVAAWLYFDGPMSDLAEQHQLVLDIPGGGFVAMDPRCHDDKLMAWAGKLGIPVIALDYKKAPEYPYPHALNECYDAYFQMVATRGRCVGLSGEHAPKIIISGDSAGGNLAFSTVLMILDDQSPYSGWDSSRQTQSLPPPEAVVGIYPALEMNIGNWMTDEQLSLLRRPERRTENKRIMDRKSQDFRKLTPNTPGNSDDEDDEHMTNGVRSNGQRRSKQYTRLAMSSMISYFNDRIISPEMLRAMIVLYVGEYRRPDFATDYLLSPLRAPEALLARFPKTFLLCGERDPLVDDTAIFAGRLRQAHKQEFTRRQELGLENEDAVFDDKKHVQVVLVNGVSHGFLQFVSVFPRGWQYVHACSRWMRDVFEKAEAGHEPPSSVASNNGEDYFSHSKARSRRTSEASIDGRPLEIQVPGRLRMTSISSPTTKKKSGTSHIGRLHSSRSKVTRSSNMSGRKSPSDTMHFLSRLASTEDLVGRRMDRVTGNLGQESRSNGD
ncbi:hormone-sensitive lipase like protein [Zymoseptoria brevis]|uniref:Hormone-sensitive lipase like protein n=1 Tax=Zymoseptoria brevis TaxID=1047168 RepID=A0A0F4GC05_9PEZI|nr:hormone-sensitive lipase like protein [Zymoseptoria brevis]